MEYFTGTTSDLDALTDARFVAKANPVAAASFDAIKDLKQIDPDGKLLGKDFKHVASLHSLPLLQAMKLIEPGFVEDKRKFYRWLDTHTEYCTYDRRRVQQRNDMATFVDGKVVT